MFVPVAQLDRVFGYEPKGQGFESLQARQSMISSTAAYHSAMPSRKFESIAL